MLDSSWEANVNGSVGYRTPNFGLCDRHCDHNHTCRHLLHGNSFCGTNLLSNYNGFNTDHRSTPGRSRCSFPSCKRSIDTLTLPSPINFTVAVQAERPHSFLYQLLKNFKKLYTLTQLFQKILNNTSKNKLFS